MNRLIYVDANIIGLAVQETYVRVCRASIAIEIRSPTSLMLQTARNWALGHVKRADFRLVDSFDEVEGVGQESILPVTKDTLGQNYSINHESSQMKRTGIIALTAMCLLATVSACGPKENSVESTTSNHVHFLIPSSAGGGLDMTARAVGKSLNDTGLADKTSFQNMPGGGGSRAIAHLIETARRQQDTLLVTSTPSVIRALQEVFPQSYRDLTPIASVIGDYGVLVTRADSQYTSFDDVLSDFRQNPTSVKVAGGSVRGGMDHLVAAAAFGAAGGDPRAVRYVSYDGGGKAFAGLLSGEASVLSTGLGEAIDHHRQGQIRILAVTAEERLESLPSVPTFKDLGYDVLFVNWRGFFGSPDLPEDRVHAYEDMLGALFETDEWRETRDRNGWGDLYKPSKEFVDFLRRQEESIATLMDDIGLTGVQ